jgi:hypothetical protein
MAADLTLSPATGAEESVANVAPLAEDERLC